MPKLQMVISIKDAYRKADFLAKHGKKQPLKSIALRKNLLDDIAMRKAKLYRLEEKGALQRAEKRASGKPITATDLARRISIKIEVARIELIELLAKGCRPKDLMVVKKINSIKELQGQKRLAKGGLREQAEKGGAESKRKKGC